MKTFDSWLFVPATGSITSVDKYPQVLGHMINPKHGHLAAAAPDLLHSLEDLVRCLRDFQMGDYSPLMDEIFDAERAIAHAKNLKEIRE